MTRNPQTFLHDLRVALKTRWVKGRVSAFVFEFLCFGIKQAWACLFGGLMLVVLLGTYLFYPDTAFITRYDFITLVAVGIQAILLLMRLETLEEARVILVFHIVGTAMEIFKTQMGSWTYPEPSVLRIADVPLFSGFMYACVGSYIARAWRIFDFRFTRFPPLWAQAVLAALIYLNFFTHHFAPDMRIALFGFTVLLYGPSWIYYKPDTVFRTMPLVVGLFLVATFIWFAENIATFARAWTYPDQAAQWTWVGYEKLGSWFLLMIISFVLVAWVHKPARRP